MKNFFFVILFLIYNSYCARHTKEEWRSRSIYQIVTDRFAKDEKDTKSDCENLRDYCGGTFKGIQHQLDYISGMGFDAIWISPILKNAKGAYHGYHIIDYYNVNEHFGTSDDLKELIKACHSKNIWVILDAVPNHMAPDVDFSSMIPFNKDEYYHEECEITDEDNIEQREKCWLYGLPDLDQDNPFVRKTLLEWVKNMIIEYDFDGVRYADVPYISKSFWKEFTEYANTYAFGIVCGNYVNQVAHYQKYMDAVGNFPLFYIMRDCFSGSSLKKIDEYLKKNHTNFMNPSYDGIFIDNHDNPRFMNISKNKNGLKNAIVFTFFFEGIPFFYYGDEQYFDGGADPFNREVMFGRHDTSSDFYQMMKIVNEVRKREKIYYKVLVQRYVDDNIYAFTRGNVLIVVTNTNNKIEVKFNNHRLKIGDKFCNALLKEDCIIVNDNIDISMNGEPKIYIKQ